MVSSRVFAHLTRTGRLLPLPWKGTYGWARSPLHPFSLLLFVYSQGRQYGRGRFLFSSFLGRLMTPVKESNLALCLPSLSYRLRLCRVLIQSVSPSVGQSVS